MVQTRIEERLEMIDQEITLMKKELGKMPIIELSLNDIAKNMETMRSQSDKQQQMLLMIMETMAKDRSAVSDRTTKSFVRDSVMIKGKENEATSSKSAVSDRNDGDSRNERKTEIEEVAPDRNKFKKVEMLVFAGEDPNSWLFRAKRTTEIIIRINSETTVDEYRNLFDKLVAPLCDVQESIIEDTFMNGLFPWIRAEVAFCRLKGFAEMMEVAQLVENRELIRNEANLNGFAGGKYPPQATANNSGVTGNNAIDNKGNTSFPMRTITLRSSNTTEVRKDTNSRRLPDAEFQARKEKGLCFRCNKKYSTDHKCKMKELCKLKMFVVIKEGEEYEIIEENAIEEKTLTMLQVEEEQKAYAELSINSIVGLNDPGTIKVRGKLQGREVLKAINNNPRLTWKPENREKNHDTLVFIIFLMNKIQ
ncbi:transposon Tf2-1 polyprotein isoform X1 [Cucumis melo var. makuwa]|uniref:Transposon Tf2-1 polyprotein isoform X1 n=1 Tax=Cucumis melo var. makuwa TaxID=1194695 RepID=A0A5A7U3N3_CUCMM|nr:transposon Tf2-1 polyprotein isoform X1 [Cucumis melo var. makuwa]TYK08663.1 transposon Tf2-1 polyprotein isoform X1 [Cucumis melo var. makuwa]